MPFVVFGASAFDWNPSVGWPTNWSKATWA